MARKGTAGSAGTVAAVVFGFAFLVGTGRAAPILIGCDVTADRLYRIDPVTAALTSIGPLSDDVVASLTYDSVHNILYGSSTQTRRPLGIDPNTAAITAIGNLYPDDGLMHAMEYDSVNDVLYGMAEDDLCTINPSTGATTRIGSVGFQHTLGGMAFDPAANVMYLSTLRGTSALWTVDLTTAAMTHVGDFNNSAVEQMTGLAYDPSLGLYGVDNSGAATPIDQLFSINPSTGQATLVGDLQNGNFLGLTFIPEPSTACMLGLMALAWAGGRRDRC